MNELTCAACGEMLKDGEPHCSQCNASMKCTASECTCECGNTAKPDAIKCDACLKG